MQLAIYQNYGGDLIADLTWESQDVEFSTNKYGFGYCKFRLNWQINRIAPLFKLLSVAYIRLGTATESYFEGRLEDIQLSDSALLTAFGYWRAFSDLQVNELWSTTDISRFKVLPKGVRTTQASPDKFESQLQGSIYHSAKKNETFSSSVFTLAYIKRLANATRGLNTITAVMNLRNTAVVSNIIGSQSIDSNYNAGVSGPIVTTTLSGYRESFTVFYPENDSIGLFLNTNFAALYVGETGDLSVKFDNIRVGTSTSISGGRLYADEVLRFTISGVNTLNPFQVSTNFSSIQSPTNDIKDLIFEKATGIDVINRLLAIPDSSGNYYEFKIWEKQKVVFRRKQSNAIWYINISDIDLNRTLNGYYSQIKTSVTNVIGDSVGIQTNVANPSFNRQINLDLNTNDSTFATTASNAALNDYARKPPQSNIEVQYVKDSQGQYQNAIEVRSGDTVIIQNIPPSLLSVINNTFIVDETIANMSTGMVQLIPEKPLAMLDSILSKVKF